MDLPSFSAASVALLDYYHWTTVTLLRDRLHQFPLITTVYYLLYVNLRDLLEKTPGAYSVYIQEFESENRTNYEDILGFIEVQSRSKCLFCSLSFYVAPRCQS